MGPAFAAARAALRYHRQPPMATRSKTTKLAVTSREAVGSRAVRRLRRAGRVPGVVYGGNDGPLSFDVDERELRHALAARGAVLDLAIDDAASSPVVLKDTQRDPVRGETLHVDLVRVRLDRAIHATVPLELTGVDDAPGVKEGGVLEQITRELNVEALPTAIPESISFDVSAMEINETLVLSAIPAPPEVKLLDDPEETLIATLAPPRLQVEEESEIEAETELVGEGGEPVEATGEEGEAAAGEAAEGGESGE
jgi:large subunit ribosomal protein L25